MARIRASALTWILCYIEGNELRDLCPLRFTFSSKYFKGEYANAAKPIDESVEQ